MKMIKAVIRPEKTDEVANALMDAGFPGMTKIDAYGRGKQKGLKIGNVFYDELPKQLIMMVVHDADEEKVVKIILEHAQTGENGNYGDGKVFVVEVLKTYTISSKSEGL